MQRPESTQESVVRSLTVRVIHVRTFKCFAACFCTFSVKVILLLPMYSGGMQLNASIKSSYLVRLIENALRFAGKCIVTKLKTNVVLTAVTLQTYGLME